VTWYLPVDQLRRMLTAVIPLASTDKALPRIGLVVLRRRGQWLTAEAGDRYVAGVARERAGEEAPPSGWRVDLPLAKAKEVLALAKGGIYRESTGSVPVDSVAGVTVFGWVDQGHVTVDPPAEPAPDHGAAIRPHLLAAGSWTPWIHLNPAKAAQFRGARNAYCQQAYDPLDIRPGQGLGFVVRAGQGFVGVLMGCRPGERLASPLDDPSSWDGLI
jgi:hypothetical protein